MSDDTTLDDLLNDETPEPEVEEPEAEAAPEAEEPEQETTDEPEAEAPKADEKPSQMVPLAALQQEREKSRGVSERLSQIEAMLQQQGQSQSKLPDMFEQPEAYQQAIQKMVAEREANIVAEMSERFARTQHGDDVVEAAFEAAQASGVLDQFRGKRDAWGDLVKWHKSQRVISEIGDDPDKWREQERERIRQEIQAQMTAESVKQSAAKAAPSLAGQSNLGSRQSPAWSGPTPLDDILGG